MQSHTDNPMATKKANNITRPGTTFIAEVVQAKAQEPNMVATAVVIYSP